jgi:hypothetical protein
VLCGLAFKGAGTTRRDKNDICPEINLDFETFWGLFPRREAKKDAMKAWAQMTEGQKFEAVHALPTHVQFWNLSGRSRQYLPMPATWLRGERWADELEMPEVKSAGADWMRSKEGIEQKAKEVGCWPARANEDWHSLKARILLKMEKVAA